ncbi:unnamed protein product [Rangifer tarandus platyrhynchus]|uniref:Uncharacterized protein n=2 Tax=Rangifer tarandus platyrhynchus TaxID=3082113 RepID=A0ACB0FEL2_RANTA|nr:unnamed protein product [Rangifer tarandus platyrhynchus]CAI9711371.1 unnamed protein product [Rangifer tarandus platyrhynchus]
MKRLTMSVQRGIQTSEHCQAGIAKLALNRPGPCRRLGKPSGESRGGQRGPTNPQTECQDHQAPWGTLSALHSAARAQRHKPLATTVTARRAPGRWHAYADRCGCLGPPRPQRRDSGTFHPRFSGT